MNRRTFVFSLFLLSAGAAAAGEAERKAVPEPAGKEEGKTQPSGKQKKPDTVSSASRRRKKRKQRQKTSGS